MFEGYYCCLGSPSPRCSGNSTEGPLQNSNIANSMSMAHTPRTMPTWIREATSCMKLKRFADTNVASHVACIGMRETVFWFKRSASRGDANELASFSLLCHAASYASRRSLDPADVMLGNCWASLQQVLATSEPRLPIVLLFTSTTACSPAYVHPSPIMYVSQRISASHGL
jgi:hypothetical protein